MTDLQRRGLLASIASRLPAASLEELRVVDLVFDRLEHGRLHAPARIQDSLDAVGGDLVRWAQRILVERDQEREELHEAARDEQVGPAMVPLRQRSCNERAAYIIQTAQVGAVAPEFARELLAANAAPDELAEWRADAHETRISDAPARLALDADPEPYEVEYDFEGGGG